VDQVEVVPKETLLLFQIVFQEELVILLHKVHHKEIQEVLV
tara:strand:+ start:343 stop:465 length:123 start_codon:yes stop_codon:yes gene_type:complete